MKAFYLFILLKFILIQNMLTNIWIVTGDIYG